MEYRGKNKWDILDKAFSLINLEVWIGTLFDVNNII